jgi:hypothetical protein
MPANGKHEPITIDAPPIGALIPAAIDALALQRQPDTVIEEATRAAKAIAAIIQSREKPLVINGKTYLQFEDWQTLGRFYGVTAKATSAKYVEFGQDYEAVRGFEATADALLISASEVRVISSAEAMCLDDENKWTDKPLFQLKSMAQTRACAKAMRNVLAWIVVLAGYSGTPAEEMDDIDHAQRPRRKSEIASGSRKKPAATAPAADHSISFIQQKELFDLGHQVGLTPQEVMKVIAKCGYNQPGDISPATFQKVCAEIKKAAA